MKKVFTFILLLAAMAVPLYLSASAMLPVDGDEGGGDASSAVTIDTDLTAQFPLDWQGWSGATGFVGWAAPEVTTNDGRQTPACEKYESTCAPTGVVFSRQLQGLANGIYTIELYGAAAYTSGRGFESELVEGDETAVYLYAETSAGQVNQFIPAHVADNFNGTGIATAVLEGVEVVNGTVEIGMYKEKGLTNWHVVQIKGVTATVDAASLLASSVAKAEAAKQLAVPAALLSEITTTIEEKNKDFDTGDEYLAAINALDAIVEKAEKYAPLGEVLAVGKSYEANVPAESEAINTYEAAIAQVEADYEAVAVDDFAADIETVKAALSALAKAQTAPGSDLTAFIVNPEINGADGWTTERPVGGNGPLLNDTSFEYWAGSANPRAEAQFDYSQVITGLPNGLYTISADMYNSLNGEGGDYTEFAPTCGLYAAAGEAEVVKLVEEDGTALNTYTTENITVTDGTLRIGVKSISPLAARWFVADNFKLTLVKAISDEEITYYAALAAINDGETYRIFTEVEGTKYFLNATGYLVADSQEAATFTFDKVVANGTLYEAGWNLGCKFTNPSLTNGSSGDVHNDGHIHVGTNDRNDWERQVFFLNDEGKFAVRSTNANSANWGANTYWDVFSETLPEAGYSLNPAYVWQLAGFVDLTELNALADKLEAQVAATDTYEDPSGAVSGISAAIEAIRNADYTSKKEADAAIAQLDELAQQFFGAITPKTAIDVTDWYIVNPEPMNIKGWEGTAFGTASDGVCEYWNKSAADFHQTINIPAGMYRLTAIALTRTGMESIIYAGENSVNIVTVESSVANNRAQAASWFAAGNGVNAVYFEMAEAGPITIGLTADANNGDHWTVWKNFKLEMVADVPADVTYNLVNGDAILATETVSQLPGDEVQVPTSFKDLMHGLYSLEADVDVIAKETTTVNITPVWAGPFEFSTDAENAKWYNMTIRGEWTVSKCETEPYTMKNDATDEDLSSAEFQWAFAPVEGDPLKVVIFNKAAEGMSLTPDDVPDGEGTRHAVVLREGNYAWEIFANADGFVLREVGTENNWVNQAGGGSDTAPLGFWISADGRTDGGSTFRVEEAPIVVIPEVVLNAPAWNVEEGTQAEPTWLPVGETLKINYSADNLEANGLSADDVMVNITVMVSGDLPENVMNMQSETKHSVMGATFSIPLGETEFPVELKEGYVYQNIVVMSAQLVKGEEVIATAAAPAQLHWIGVAAPIKGDADGDGEVDVADHAVIRDNILSEGEYDAKLDINEDTYVDVADLTGLVNILLYNNWQGEDEAAGVRGVATSDVLTLNYVGNGRYALQLQSGRSFNGLQMDINVPAGMTILSEETDGSHAVATSILPSGKTRVLVYSLNNAAFEGSNILYFNVAGQGSITADNIIFADVNANTVRMTLGDATGINGIEQAAGATIYDLSGRKADSMRHGVNIVRKADGTTKKILK